MIPSTYRTVAGPVVASVEDRRSVFECWLRHAGDEDAARAVVEEARSTHWDARHHCSAFVLGPDAATVRSNDDGEPAGTAGTPMLEVLTHSGLTEVVAVVTRWFGGTLLGTGGLVRAYSDAVRAAVDLAEARVRERVGEVDVEVPHALAGRLEHDLRLRGVGVVDARYAAAVTLRLQLPAAELVDLPALLAQLTAGEDGVGVVPGSESSGWRDVPA